MSEANAKPLEGVTEEELQALQDDPAYLLDHPDLEERLDKALQAPSSPPSEPVVPATPAPEPVAEPEQPQPGAGEPPKTAAGLPEWFAEVPEADRAKLLDEALKALPASERAKLGSVSEVLREAETVAEQRGEARASEEKTLRGIHDELGTARTSFLDSLAKADADVPALLDGYTREAQKARGLEITDQMERGLDVVMRYMGISDRDIPPAVQKRMDDAPNLGALLAEWGKFFANRAYSDGQGKAAKPVVSEAEEIANRARSRHEALADLARDKRIRIGKDQEGLFAEYVDNTPPQLGEAGPVSGGSELTEDEWNRYRRLVAEDPLSIPDELQAKVDKAMASPVGAR